MLRSILAKRIISGQNDLFSMYASSHSMPNLSVTIHSKNSSLQPETDSDPPTNEDEEEQRVRSVPDLTDSSNSLADPLSAKKLSELDNLLFPRIQDKSRTPSVTSFHEKSTEVINMERMKNKNTLLSHYFEDGKRRVDYVIVFNKPSNNSKGEDHLHLEQRSIFEVSSELERLGGESYRNRWNQFAPVRLASQSGKVAALASFEALLGSCSRAHCFAARLRPF